MHHHRPPTPPSRAEILAELRRQLAKAGTRGPVKFSVGLARAILDELEEPPGAGAAGRSTEEIQDLRKEKSAGGQGRAAEKGAHDGETEH